MTAQPNGPFVAGTAVVLTDEWLVIARQAVLIADAARRRNGLPHSTKYIALAEAFTTALSMSDNRHSDVDDLANLQDYPQTITTVTIAEAAKQLGLCERQTLRYAPQLGGRKIGGRWLLDQGAIDEHLEGKKWAKTA